ncbi:MAG: hypothetical protein J2P55_06425 [Rhizobiales bacterium]|nr:hypothetical protein [Hyphomicrobiales bacterium]
MPPGCDRALYILPFDYRGSFQAQIFGWKSPLSEAQTAEISRAKEIAKRYREFVDMFEGENARLPSEPSDRTGAEHHPQRRPDTCS